MPSPIIPNDEVRRLVNSKARDLVEPYAKGKTDLVLGIGREVASRAIEWFMSPERVAKRRKRRTDRRESRAARRG